MFLVEKSNSRNLYHIRDGDKYLHCDEAIRNSAYCENGAMTGFWLVKTEAELFLEKYFSKNKKQYSFNEMIEEGGVFKKLDSMSSGKLFIAENGLSLYKDSDGNIEVMDSSWKEDTFEKVGESFDLVYKELE